VTLPWPIHPPPRPGEQLDSWIGRLAKDFGLAPSDFARSLLGTNLTLLKSQDPLPATLVTDLSSRTRVGKHTIERMQLAGLPPWNSIEFPSQARVGFLVSEDRAPSIDNSKFIYKHRWLSRGCRVCLSERQPYTRTLWSCSAISSCIEHRVMLDGFDPLGIIDDPASPLISSPAELDTMDRRTVEAITTGFVTLPNRVLDAAAWFRLLQAALHELMLPKAVLNRELPIAEAAWSLSGRDKAIIVGRGQEFDKWLPDVQVATLAAASHLIEIIENDPPIGRGGFASAFGATLSHSGPTSDLPLAVVFPQRITSQSAEYLSRVPELMRAAIENARHNVGAATQLYGLLSFPEFNEESAERAIADLRHIYDVEDDILTKIAGQPPCNPIAKFLGIYIGASREHPWKKIICRMDEWAESQ
jgi:hypothetical protein